MKTAELAAALNGNQYRSEISNGLEAEAKASGLVVVFGASDDLMEFRGAIHDELDAYNGTTAYFDSSGLLTNDCEDEDCPHFAKLKAKAKTIEAIWNFEDRCSWAFTSEIPHATFEVMEDGDLYCLGIVFALADLASN